MKTKIIIKILICILLTLSIIALEVFRESIEKFMGLDYECNECLRELPSRREYDWALTHRTNNWNVE